MNGKVPDIKISMLKQQRGRVPGTGRGINQPIKERLYIVVLSCVYDLFLSFYSSLIVVVVVLHVTSSIVEAG